MKRWSVLCLLGAMPAAAAAQAVEARRSFRLAVENDFIAVRGAGAPPDYEYTHGTRIATAWPGAPGWARRTVGAKPGCARAGVRTRGRVTTAVELGQEIYTPRRDAPVPTPGERPYAGWLYLSAAASTACGGHLRSFGLALGVTGPPSLAAQFQNAIHHVLRNEPQLGWVHQVAFEPGLMLQYRESVSRERLFGDGLVARAALRWGAVAGNVRTALHVGAAARIGVPGRLAWVPAEPEVERPLRLYVLAAYRGDVVLRDLTINGNTFRASARAELRPLVDQYELGAGLRRHSYTLEYRYVSRGREYRAEPGRHAYGTIALTLHRF